VEVVSTLRAVDLRAALGLVEALESCEAAAPFTGEFMLALQALFNADLVSYHEEHAGRIQGVRVPVPLPVERSGVPPYVNPLFRYIKVHPEAARLSDFLTRRALRNNLYYDQNLRPLQLEYELAVKFGSRPSMCILVERGGSRDFSERDCELLTVLRPHFIARCRRREHARRLAQLALALFAGSYDSLLAANGGQHEGLTYRESEILDWVREGLTNKEIGTRLAISPETVRKHLENAYAKLGVHTRTAAVRARSHP
jgi:DNA-binding CsgD family transcriptional regulator